MRWKKNQTKIESLKLELKDKKESTERGATIKEAGSACSEPIGQQQGCMDKKDSPWFTVRPKGFSYNIYGQIQFTFETNSHELI